MKSYEVTGKSAGLPPGALVRLTAQQAIARMHNLELVKKAAEDGRATYRIKNAIEFKAGEVFGTDAEMNKAQASMLHDLAEPKPEPQSKGKRK